MSQEKATIPSLIQGVSQQALIARGRASADDQENCLNDVKDGAVSRMGSIVVAEVDTAFPDAFVYEIVRSRDEIYMVIVKNGDMRIFNVVSGVEAVITGDIDSYLACTGVARKAFTAVSLGDVTFLANRQVLVGMDSATSAARPLNAMAHFKAGAYLTTYTMTITVDSVEYSTSYETPDNSTEANAEYITTDSLAANFKSAFDTYIVAALNSASKTGFTCTRSGSTLLISSTTHDFTIDTTDGQGDRQFLSFKDKVRAYTDLPVRAFDGYQVAVGSEDNQEGDYYYLTFSGTGMNGEWTETVAPGVVIDFDASTMPHILTNTALNAFTVAEADWGARLAGDGDLTAPDPSFVGWPIHSMQRLSGRLALCSEVNSVLSRSRNAYVFFPDTVQTNLDSAPIDYDVSNGSSTAITYAIMAGGKLSFWGDLQQTVLDSGNDPLREDTTEVLPMSNYEYDGEAPPKALGLGSIMFGTELGDYSKVMEVFFRQGRADGEIAISAHVPELLSGKMRFIATGQAAEKAIIGCTGAENHLYLYEYYNQGTERVQSAWNTWKFASCQSILSAFIVSQTLYMLVEWTSGCTIEKVILNSTGDESTAEFPLRLDHRVDHTDASHDGTEFTLDLPYDVPEADRGLFVCVEQTTETDVSQRGRQIAFTWESDTQITVQDTDGTKEWFFGSVPVARRKFSQFYAQDADGQPIIHERLLISKMRASHSNTATYKALVTKHGPVVTTEEFTGRVLGDPTVANQETPIVTGSFPFSVGEEAENAGVELVNDSVFPCIWTAAEVTYELTLRSSAGRKRG